MLLPPISPNPRSQDYGPGQTRKAAHSMNNGRSGKILKAHLIEPTAPPFPEAADRVDEPGQDGAINQVRTDPHAASDGPRNDRRGRGGKDGLKQPVRLRTEGPVGGRFIASEPRATEGQVFVHACIDTIIARIHQAEADYKEEQDTDADIHRIFEQDVDGILRGIKTSLDHGKSGLHEEDQNGREKQKGVIESISNPKIGLDCRFRGSFRDHLLCRCGRRSLLGN